MTTIPVSTPSPLYTNRAANRAANIFNAALRTINSSLGNQEQQEQVVAGGLLTDTAVGPVLIIFLDWTKVAGRLARLTSADMLRSLRVATGLPVYVADSKGIRYIFPLRGRPSLPKKENYPGWRRGVVQLGVKSMGRTADTTWKELGHTLIAGMTQWGKSTALRLLTAQAVQEGFDLYLGDYYGNTFGPIADIDHPQVKFLARSSEDYINLVRRLLIELESRIEIFRNATGAPDNIWEYNALVGEKINPILVVIDEHTAATKDLDGRGGEYNQGVEKILRTGLKYGIQVVLASQDFYIEDVDRVRSHCATKICLRVESASLSRTILQSPGAEHIRVKGRALTNRWGEIQMYLVSKDELVRAFSKENGLSPDEQRLLNHLFSYSDRPGWVDLERIREFYPGCSYGRAKAIRARLVEKGLAAHRPDQNNAVFLVQKEEVA